MFHLHDTTRRRVCIAGFLALGLAPVLVVAGWCLSRHLPGCVEAEARQLSQRLGLRVKLGGLKHLRPADVLYEHVEVADPETGQTIFRCRSAEIRRTPPKDAQGRPTLVVTLSQPELDAASIDRIWQCLQRTLAGSYGPIESDVQFSAADLTLSAGDSSQTFTDVQGIVGELPGKRQAQVEFRLAGADTPELARIGVVRSREVSPPTSGFELYTGGGELPCSVLAMGLRELKPLGSRCRFHGYIWASETPDGWQGEVAGQLAELDLGALVSDHFPQKLSGIGQATVRSARFRGGRLEEGNATIVAGPGMIDRALLEAAVDHLGLSEGAEPLPAGQQVPYQQLAFSATLDAQGLRLLGLCGGGTPGSILSDGRRQLLGESPQQQPAPVVALVQTLVPQNAVQVPGCRQTDWLLQHLPVPPLVPIPGADDAGPHARLRMPLQR